MPWTGSKKKWTAVAWFARFRCVQTWSPPPPDADPESLIQLHRNAAKMAIANYAANHDDFYEVMFDAALDHLLDGVLTDDLFAPDKEFAPTKEEVDTMNRAKETAELVNGLFHGLADILKTIWT